MITVLSSLAILVDQVIEIPWINQVEHLTLSGALIVAVVVLWKSNDKKDQTVVTLTGTITNALAATATSNAELRRIIDESVKVKQELRESIDRLGDRISALPCTGDGGDDLPRVRGAH